MASGSTQGVAEQDVDQATARAILQSWSEVKGEDGSVARTITQCAQTWPFTDASTFENIDAALNVLRRACEYLHQGMTNLGATVEQNADITRVQGAVHELAEHIQVVRVGLTEEVSRQNALSTRIDGMAERLQAAHGRLETMGAQFEQGYGAQSSQVTELRQSVEETQRQVTRVSDRLELSQVDAGLDQGLPAKPPNPLVPLLLHSQAKHRQHPCRQTMQMPLATSELRSTFGVAKTALVTPARLHWHMDLGVVLNYKRRQTDVRSRPK